MASRAIWAAAAATAGVVLTAGVVFAAHPPAPPAHSLGAARHAAPAATATAAAHARQIIHEYWTSDRGRVHDTARGVVIQAPGTVGGRLIVRWERGRADTFTITAATAVVGGSAGGRSPLDPFPVAGVTDGMSVVAVGVMHAGVLDAPQVRVLSSPPTPPSAA